MTRLLPMTGIRHSWWRFREWRRRARDVTQRCGKHFVRQACEIAKLRFGDGLSGREYYDYGLYDDRRFPPAAKREFLGLRHMKDLYRRLNRENWYGISDDKLLFYSLLSSIGLPYPRLSLLCHKN